MHLNFRFQSHCKRIQPAAAAHSFALLASSSHFSINCDPQFLLLYFPNLNISSITIWDSQVKQFSLQVVQLTSNNISKYNLLEAQVFWVVATLLFVFTENFEVLNLFDV